MTAETVAAIVFATAVAVATAALALAATGRVGRRPLLALTTLLGAAAAGTWVLFAFEPTWRVALAALGTTASAAIAAGAFALRRLLGRVHAIDDEIENARRRLADTAQREAQERTVELEQALARARAESLSLLAEEERRIADERRHEVAEREREANATLSETLTAVRQRLEERLTTWAHDLERSQQGLAEELARVSERQKVRMQQIEAKIDADTKSLQTSADDQKALTARLRAELDKQAQAVNQNASAELEAHAAERRRALHEVADRLRKRERDLSEQIEREEANASERIQSSLGDIERRHVEQLERVVKREAARFAEAASEQFEGQIKTAREDAARRLARELDLAVERFGREAQAALAERMLQVRNTSIGSVDRRLGELRAGFERERDEFLASLEQRTSEVDAQLRTRLREVTAEAEAERLAIETRLQELNRRVDDLLARFDARVR